MRHLLPPEARDLGRLMSSDNASLGSLGTVTTRIRDANRVALPDLRHGASAYERTSRDTLLRHGDLAARAAAIAESAYGVPDQRPDAVGRAACRATLRPHGYILVVGVAH